MHTLFAIASIILFLAGGIVLTFGPQEWFPGFYNPSYMGVMAFLNAFILISLSWFFPVRDTRQKIAFMRTRTIFVVALLLNAAGALGLYKLYRIGIPYDKFLHFLIPLLLTIALVHLRVGWRHSSLPAALSWSLIVVFTSGIGWEFWESFSDWIFGTQSWGIYQEYIVTDTAFDILMNTLGILTAAGIMRFGLVSAGHDTTTDIGEENHRKQ